MNSATARPKIIIICGPTGIGKTAVAIVLAQHFNGQIIGADSMQVYKHMDIGTAKPTAEEKTCVVHHMIDIVDPDQGITVLSSNGVKRVQNTQYTIEIPK